MDSLSHRPTAAVTADITVLKFDYRQMRSNIIFRDKCPYTLVSQYINTMTIVYNNHSPPAKSDLFIEQLKNPRYKRLLIDFVIIFVSKITQETKRKLLVTNWCVAYADVCIYLSMEMQPYFNYYNLRVTIHQTVCARIISYGRHLGYESRCVRMVHDESQCQCLHAGTATSWKLLQARLKHATALDMETDKSLECEQQHGMFANCENRCSRCC